MKLTWFYKASESLEAIGRYIAQDNPSAAYATLHRIQAAAASLPENPRMGRVGRVKGTRELVVTDTPYILAYRVKKDELQILHVLHGARRWPKVF